MPDILRRIISANRAGRPVAIPSVCSAHADVIRASLMLAERLDRPLVIEATSNQVNQDGGYTGMTAGAFIRFVRDLAAQTGTDADRITFGGDHLGPQAWRSLPVEQAMAKAQVMVADYARAGFTKIHLDCSEGCAGEAAQLTDAQTVPRAAALARTVADITPDALFVVGTEVPPPGGARTDDHGDIPPTTPDAARATLDAHWDAFATIGTIGGLVVQPGVEFSPMQVHHLPTARDPGLLAAIAHRPGVCLEAHSTDYQRAGAYPQLAALGFAFQKVGPALTFAWRQAVYALDQCRSMAGWGEPIVRDEMEQLMLADPRQWQSHYHGSAADRQVMRHFGLADRIRYYWPHQRAQRAVALLMDDMNARALPDPLLWQVFAPAVLDRAESITGPRAQALVLAQVQEALAPYFFGDTP